MASSPNMLMRRAARHHLAGELREAASLYRKLLQDDPQHAGALHALGVMAHQTGRQEAAEKLLLRAVATDPSLAAAHDDLGALWLLQGKTEQAAAAFGEAIRVDPKYALAHAHLGAAMSKLGRHDAATASYQRAVDTAMTSVRRFKGVGIDVTAVTESIQATRAAPSKPAADAEDYGQYVLTDADASGNSAAGDDDDDDGVVGLTLMPSTGAGERLAPLAARAEEVGLAYASMAGVSLAPSVYAWAVPEEPWGLSAVTDGEPAYPVISPEDEPTLGLAEFSPGELEPSAIMVWNTLGPDEPGYLPIEPDVIDFPAEPVGWPEIAAEDDLALAGSLALGGFREPLQAVPLIEAEVGDPRYDAPYAMIGGASYGFGGALGRSTVVTTLLQDDGTNGSNGHSPAHPTIPMAPPEPTLFDTPLVATEVSSGAVVEPAVGDDDTASSISEAVDVVPVEVSGEATFDSAPIESGSAGESSVTESPTAEAASSTIPISPSEIIDVVPLADDEDEEDTEVNAETQDDEDVDAPIQLSPIDLPGSAPAPSRMQLPPSASRLSDDPVLAPRMLAKELRRARRKPVAGARQAAELHKQGTSHLRQRRVEEAISALQRLVELQPTSAKAHRDLGAAYIRGDRFDDAIASLQRALELRPRFADAFASLGDVFHLQGRVEEAINCYRQTLALRPSAVSAHSNLLLNLNYQRKNDAQTLFAEHIKWAKTHASPLTKEIVPHENTPLPDRQLRIGYVSGDFRRHAVGSFIEPILANREAGAFHVICYSDVLRPDDVTERISAMSDGWRDVRGLSDVDVCEMVRHDQIDILVDLAGHTGSNRLCVFARKPAPVQVSYLGYPNTTGMATIDYRITDAWADPLGQTEQFHSEQLYRLPRGFLCYQGPADAPAPSAPPVAKNGFVTFGCFNILAKLTPETLGLWAKIMTVLPNSRMVLKDRLGTLANPARRRYVQDIFAYHRIAAERLELLGKEPDRQKHLESYSKVDVMLDPFPYNGTTTTCEALWMGVPVITLAGTRHASRVGVSILKSAGLPEFVAPNIETYARSAVLLARDVNRLVLLRRTLRQKLSASSLCDAPKFTKLLGMAYREMWTYWCQTRGTPMLPSADRMSLEG